MRTVGVEDELLLVDPEDGTPRPVAHDVLAAASRAGSRLNAFQMELQREQVEVTTRPWAAMDELAADLAGARREAASHAEKAGAAAVALATSPMAVRPSLSSHERYRRLGSHWGMTFREELTCGCHIHVAVESDEEGVAVLDRIRPWLPVLLALSANSPFWQGEDSHYGSYRSRVLDRCPQRGPTEVFGSAERYREHVRAMVDTGVLWEEAMAQFDARLSYHFPTVEIRVADVCLDVSSAVLLAALARGLVETAAREWRCAMPPGPQGAALLRLASWRAARSGLDGELVHPATGKPAPALGVVRALVAHVRDALRDSDDLALVQGCVGRVLRHGNGARVQRGLLSRTGSLPRLVSECVRLSVAG